MELQVGCTDVVFLPGYKGIYPEVGLSKASRHSASVVGITCVERLVVARQSISGERYSLLTYILHLSRVSKETTIPSLRALKF